MWVNWKERIRGFCFKCKGCYLTNISQTSFFFITKGYQSTGVVGRGIGQHKGDHWPIERQNEMNFFYFKVTYKKDKCNCKRKMTPMSPPMWIMVLLHLQVGLILYVIPKWTSRELEVPPRLLPPFKDEHLQHVWTNYPATYLPQGQPLGSQMVGWFFFA